MIRALFLFSCFFSYLLAYERPENVDEVVWAKIEPFLLPETHPLKPQLDTLFKTRKIMHCRESLYSHGFKFLAHNKKNGLLVANHPAIKGKVIKIFPESSETDEAYNFSKRVRGAQAIQHAIDRHQWGDQFRVPTKWIYLLPPDPTSKGEKNFILIADNVRRIKDHETQLQMWRSHLITKDLLTRLYILIKEAGMADSVYIANIPICHDGRVAFVDTEHYHNRGIPYERLLRSLNPQMRDHWQWLIDHNYTLPEN